MTKYTAATLWVQEYAFTLLFSAFCLYFIQNMVFVPEANRISNETTTWAVFISALFAFLSLLTVKQTHEKQSVNQELKFKENRKYTKDKELLNN